MVDANVGVMEERGKQNSETAENHLNDRDDEISECRTVREIATCRRKSEAQPFSGVGPQRQAMILEATHRGHRPTTSNRSSPLNSSPGRLDDVPIQSGMIDEQSDRLRASGTAVEASTDRGEEDASRRLAADSLRVATSPSDGQLDLAVTESKHFLHRPPINSFQSEATRATKSPPVAGQTSLVTAFSVADILDPGKFGTERRERLDAGLSEPRLRPGDSGGPRRELWSPWMQRLELQLRAGAAGINNFNFLRSIGQFP